MKTEKENDYWKVFNMLYDKCDEKFPDYIVIDFEVSAYVAFKKATKSKIYFCLFHFGQCIFRKLQKLGLAKDFLTNIEFRMFIKCVTSLAFVPPRSVEIEYQKILRKSSTFANINLVPFFNYFEKNFLNGTKYPIVCWNAYERVINNIPLTSNAAESFNRHFYSKFDQCHPGLTTFFDKLKVQQSNVENYIEQRMVDVTKIQETLYTRKLDTIKTICRNYDSYYIWHFLKQ